MWLGGSKEMLLFSTTAEFGWRNTALKELISDLLLCKCSM